MAHIRYDIVPHLGGWSIACNGVLGPPYRWREAAIRDAAWAAGLLGKAGEDASVSLDGEAIDIDLEKPARDTRH